MAKSLTDKFRRYISERVPRTVTNVIFQLFQATENILENISIKVDLLKKERNILTAQNISSLRTLAAQNGFEPKLKTPSSGLLLIKVSPKLFTRVGYPLFIRPYSVFTCVDTKMQYHYISDVTLRLDNNELYVPAVEGVNKERTITGTGELLQRIYFDEDSIADNSIRVDVGGINFIQVNSFFDQEGINDNKQYLLKYSNDTQQPIIIYVKGAKQDDLIHILYRLTSGENGNISDTLDFETESIIDTLGDQIIPKKDEISITNISGFRFGSDGTDVNSLRAAIGYNHGSMLLYDNQSYMNFLGKFSTILIQNIIINKAHKQINNIYLSKRQGVNTEQSNTLEIINQYKLIIQNKTYYLPDKEKNELRKLLSEYEYCLSSHNLYNSLTTKYAIQITFWDINLDKVQDLQTRYSEDLLRLIYLEFQEFLSNKFYVLNFELLIDTFAVKNNLTLTYKLFNSDIEELKITETDIIKKQQYQTSYIIKHEDKLPLLCGDFKISVRDVVTNVYSDYQLYNDVNISSKQIN
jgi:hypothetical protein